MKKITESQFKTIISNLPHNPRVVSSGNSATPLYILQLINEEIETFTLHMVNAPQGIPAREGITHESAFVGKGMRHSSNLNYIPCRLSMVPILFKEHLVPDLVIIHTSSIINNTVSLGIEVNILPAAIESARKNGGIVIAQASKQMPYTYGDAVLHEHEVDYYIEVDEPLHTVTPKTQTDLNMSIGERVAHYIPDSATLQLGIGGIPDAVLKALNARKDLRLWTEMFTDGLMHLHNQGNFNNNIPLTASFLFGSEELYRWVDHNHRVRMLRTEKTNDPAVIARHPLMMSINSALQVDLLDQANASWVNNKIYSGFGGSTDFIVGALHSPQGHAFIALPSWHPKANVSTIIPKLTTPATSFQHSAVITENGAAWCFGNNSKTQAKYLIEKAAHPDAREELKTHLQLM